MKLYFSPGACSLHPHIALLEAELPFELVRVDTRSHRTQSGADFYAINPKGYVPVLELDDGARLTEGAVIDQFIADRAPESKLAPPAGTMARYRLQEWLNFVASEIHKSFGPLFGSASEEAKNQARTRVSARLDLVERQLEKTPYLLGGTILARYETRTIAGTSYQHPPLRACHRPLSGPRGSRSGLTG